MEMATSKVENLTQVSSWLLKLLSLATLGGAIQTGLFLLAKVNKEDDIFT